jgi:hypothetical protein
MLADGGQLSTEVARIFALVDSTKAINCNVDYGLKSVVGASALVIALGGTIRLLLPATSQMSFRTTEITHFSALIVVLSVSETSSRDAA